MGFCVRTSQLCRKPVKARLKFEMNAGYAIMRNAVPKLQQPLNLPIVTDPPEAGSSLQAARVLAAMGLGCAKTILRVGRVQD